MTSRGPAPETLRKLEATVSSIRRSALSLSFLSPTARRLLGAALSLCLSAPALAKPLPLTGFNLAGAEFGRLPGRPGTDYFYPSESDVGVLLSHGANVFRLPFRWERLQPTLGAPLDEAELGRLLATIKLITDAGARVIVSPHNYARYRDQVLWSPDVPIAAFAGFWADLAGTLRDNSLVAFGLMNEPHDIDVMTWREAAGAALAAIRGRGATNLVLVPGAAWTGGHNWASPDHGVSNAVAMADIRDPLDNFAYEIHQYLDADYSGTHAQCGADNVGVQALEGVTDWLARHRAKGFLAEFGSTADATCLRAMDSMLSFVEAHPSAWMGWTYWAAGSWWGDNWMSAQPRDGSDPPQLTTLMKHMKQP